MRPIPVRAATADGRIATIFQERLLQLGAWLATNGEAVYNSTVWRAQNDTAAHGVERGVYYTASKTTDAAGVPTAIYAFMLGWPEDNVLTLTQPIPPSSSRRLRGGEAGVRMFGCSKPMAWQPALHGLPGDAA